MKLIFVNVNPFKKFNREKSVLVKLQIDNCIELGWKVEDIILATNFDYEYRGVKATIVTDENYCGIDDKRYAFKVSTHILTVASLFKQGLFEKDKLYWYHDLDAYQEYWVTEEELKLGNVDLGLTDYGWSPKWNLGSFFFKHSAGDVLKLLRDTVVNEKVPDERALRMLVEKGKVTPDRYRKLNITYNFGMRDIDYNWKIADKPLKVIHFHPCYKDPNIPETTLSMFMYGNNPLGKPLMSERLIKLFHVYGYKAPFGMTCSYREFMYHIGYD